MLKCKYKDGRNVLPELERLFREDKRFCGRVPRIIREMAAVSGFYNISAETVVDNFHIQNVQALLSSGLAPGEVVLLYASLSPQDTARVAACPDMAPYITDLFSKGEECYKNTALWIVNHLQTEEALIKKVVKSAEDLTIRPDDTVDAVRTALSGLKSLSEIKKIEKAYKKTGFRFSECVCHLFSTEVEYNRYWAGILPADDPRQVMLGYNTACCQHLGEAGESSMMHGLLNPKAGFWALTNINSGKVLAQAEVWEENEDTLVFDNIEFANDADIDLYRETIGLWLERTPYRNVKMGLGYNEMDCENFRSCGAVTPPVTPYEIYVISHEEDAECDIIFDSEEEAREALERGEVTYFDYIYCDSENGAVWMKENGRVEPYFEAEREEEEMER